MAALPDSFSGDQSSSAGAGGSGQSITGPSRSGDADPSKKVSVEQLILDLREKPTRENALHRLSKIREIRKDLAPLLWHSFGTPYTLLKEIVEVYPLLSTPNFTQEASNRACNALSLFQCVAAHRDTKKLFVNAGMPLYIYPFLNTENREKPHEYLRLSTLGVIGALVKDNDEDIILFLLQTQVFCYCIRCIEVGTILSRTVATFIIERILMSEHGMRYCCTISDRYYVVNQIFERMLDKVAQEPSNRLLKLIIHCFMKLSEGARIFEGLTFIPPVGLNDPKLISLLSDDPVAMSWLKRLYLNIAALSQQPKTKSGPEFQNARVIKG